MNNNSNYNIIIMNNNNWIGKTYKSKFKVIKSTIVRVTTFSTIFNCTEVF